MNLLSKTESSLRVSWGRSRRRKRGNEPKRWSYRKCENRRKSRSKEMKRRRIMKRSMNISIRRRIKKAEAQVRVRVPILVILIEMSQSRTLKCTERYRMRSTMCFQDCQWMKKHLRSITKSRRKLTKVLNTPPRRNLKRKRKSKLKTMKIT